MVLGGWRRCTILGRMCANKYFANGRLTDFSLIADALISDFSVVRPILLNQISGSLGRIKWTSRIAVGKFTGMIFDSLENACSPFRQGLLWRRPLVFVLYRIGWGGFKL